MLQSPPFLLLLMTLDAALLLPFSAALGSWLWGWLAAMALMGLMLLRHARDSMQRQGQGRSPAAGLQALLDNQRTVMAGLLLIWPGLLSDLLAIALLLTAPPVVTEVAWEYPMGLGNRR